MNEFSASDPAQWTEDGPLVRRQSQQQAAPFRRLKDVILTTSTATIVAVCAINAGGADRPISVVRQATGFVITMPSTRVMASASTRGDVRANFWADLLARMDRASRVAVERDFDNEPEPFV
jgi:hypothetical protein